MVRGRSEGRYRGRDRTKAWREEKVKEDVAGEESGGTRARRNGEKRGGQGEARD